MYLVFTSSDCQLYHSSFYSLTSLALYYWDGLNSTFICHNYNLNKQNRQDVAETGVKMLWSVYVDIVSFIGLFGQSCD